jgi:Right handed beta helix region
VLIRNALQGSVVANSLHDNCAAVAVLADAPGPAGLFNVTANRITHNTKSCPASDDFPSDLSGIGVALFGATGVTVAGNTITGNVPGGSTAAQGGVVVMTGLGGTAPTSNKVVGNLIVGNDPDLFRDSAGSGNTFTGNRCPTSSPPGLCH